MLEFFSILAVGLAGGVLPLAFRWSDRQFHAALALASGVFLGAVFLHLLPMVGAVAGHHHANLIYGPRALDGSLLPTATHDHDGDGVPEHVVPAAPPTAETNSAEESVTDPAGHAGHDHGSPTPWLWVLLGVVGVYLVEALLVPGHHHHPHGEDHHCGDGHEHRRPPAAEDHADQRHRAVGWAALVGLTVHALTSGVALAAVAENAPVAGVMLLAILAHKGFESFSLASVFSMTSREPRQVFAMVVAFSLVTPVGLLLGHQVTALLGTGGIAVLTSLAAGTFLYVCIGELLPEVFHHKEDVGMKVGLLTLGIGIMYAVHQIGGV